MNLHIVNFNLSYGDVNRYPIIAPSRIPDQGFDVIDHVTPDADVHLKSRLMPNPTAAPIIIARIFFVIIYNIPRFNLL